MKPKFLILIISPVLGFFLASLFSTFVERSKEATEIKSSEPLVIPLESVAALGQLSPLGEVRSLAAPISGFGGTPRVAELLIKEGDFVKKGQVLAIFDNKPQILADLSGVRARIKTLSIKIKLQTRQVARFKQAAKQGAASIVNLEDKEDELIKLEGQRLEALAELIGLEADLNDSQLKSPIDGVVLKISSRVGERPGEEGVVAVGANHSMEALIEVYESDINRVSVGQSVLLTSENGGFKGTLKGRVKRISPQVRQRKVLSTDPTGDADARIVEVRVTLEPKSAELVKSLTGMKVIARFKLS
ncbi:HlyD family efflux transporter periplasmic adaptor subunit [Prochlorococcus sp. MIT 1307]|uniref:HlyD family efflux transporter periplasmic adaptor subunit n=1 Tax=Prochlorococcus sp. MIT 1307 TaxID=3096219 RepID=UPI002A74FD50|nr:HlyD family efflux transporter periplasmic adaptor subunit [Prochlorococcus sp. MIT 1307]